MAYFDDSGALQWPFFGALKVQTDPPEGVWQCSTLFNQRSTHLCLLEGSMVKKLHFWAKKGHFWRLWGPPATLFGDPKGPNWPPWVCLTMFNLVQLKFNPFGSAKGVYGQEYAVLGQNGHFRRFQGPPVTLFEGPKGPNRPPWVCLTMFNLVQPMFNPFGSTRGVYGQEMAFLSQNGQFWRFWGPLVTLFGGSKGPNRPPRMCWTMFNLVQPMFNPFGSARGVYGQEIAFLGQKRPFLAIKMAKITEIWWAQGWTSISPTQQTRLMQKFWQNQTFFWPPPLKHIVFRAFEIHPESVIRIKTLSKDPW